MNPLESKLEQLFALLSPLAPEQRLAHLQEHCGDDDELRQQILSLLEAHDAENVLDEPLDIEALGFSDMDQDPHKNELPGTRIGRYRILRVLGSGGMGVVCLAEQDQPVHRTVAIKIVRGGLNSSDVLARFESERQALALLDSVNVARILEAGSAEDGRPYFAMEYVDGDRITTYCDRQALDLRQRLTLFLQVCKGIEDAHQRGIIHRDIKPSNILVATSVGQPLVKIIDFGLAKITLGEEASSGAQTLRGMVFGTPEYMSPEQAQSGLRDVDTRSDIYSAGVVLYELLVGGLPQEESAHKEDAEIISTIAHSITPKPSERATSVCQHAPQTPKRRGTTFGGLQKQLRGELDWICLKALDKDRTRRYQSIGELADDIRRYLKGEAVSAGPPSVAYRLAKFVRRHRLAMGAAAAVMLAFLSAVVISTVFYFREQAAREMAEAAALETRKELVHSGRVIQYFQNLLVEMTPYGDAGQPLSLTDAIPYALQELENEELSDRDRAQLKYTLGGIFLDFDFEKAGKVLEEALEHFEKSDTTTPFDHAQCLLDLAVVRTFDKPDYTEANRLIDQALTLAQVHFSNETLEFNAIVARAGIRASSAGEPEKAERLLRRCVAVFESMNFQEADRATAQRLFKNSLARLGYVVQQDGRLAEAEEYFHRAHEVGRNAGIDTAAGRLSDFYNLADLARDLGKHEEAVVYYDSVLTLKRRLHGQKAMATLYMQGRLAVELAEVGEYARADRLLSEAMDICQNDSSCASQNLPKLQWLLGETHRVRQQWQQAESAYKQARAGFMSRYGETLHFWPGRSEYGLGVVTEARGELSRALAHFEAAHAQYLGYRGENNIETLASAFAMARVFTKLGEFAQAETWARRCFTGRLRAFGRGSAQVREHRELFKHLYEIWGKQAEAEAWAEGIPIEVTAVKTAGR